MAQRESNFINMFVTLTVVSLLASASVGFVYEVTKEPKARIELANKTAALQQILPEFNNNPLAETKTVTLDGQDFVIYPAKKDGVRVGTAVETSSPKGYGGPIKLMVGFLPDGSIKDITVLDHRETPGLGDKIDKSKSPFSRQFNGKDPAVFRLKVKKDNGDVDGITAATISSRAFCEAVQRAFEFVQKEGTL